jgi:hypothetical protein
LVSPCLAVQLQQIEGVVYEGQIGGRAVLEGLKRGPPLGVDCHQFTVEHDLHTAIIYAMP